MLSCLGGDKFSTQAVADIESTLVNEIQQVNFRDLFEPGVRHIVGFGVLLAFVVQWCGINVIFYYTKDVFAAAGYRVSAILLNIVIVGAVNLVFTFLAIHTVDRLGRRWLMLAGWSGLAAIFLVLSYCFHRGVAGLPVVMLVVAAIGCYASTLAPTSWVILSKSADRIHGAGDGYGGLTHSGSEISPLTLPVSFHALVQFGASGVFGIFAAICAAGFVLMKGAMSETKGKTLEQIERDLVDRPYRESAHWNTK